MAAGPSLYSDHQSYLEGLDQAPLRLKAEAHFLAHRPQEALRLLDQVPVETRGSAWKRLEIDALVALSRVGLAKTRLERFSDPQWHQHRRSQQARLDARKRRDGRARFGLGMYILAFSALVLGGSKKLLRPRPVVWLLGAVLLLSLWGMRQVAPTLLPVWGLIGAGALVLTHGAAAAQLRLQPGARIRLLLVTLVLLGTTGVALAALSQVDWPWILAQLSAR